MLRACLCVPGAPSGRLYPGVGGGDGRLSQRHGTLPDRDHGEDLRVRCRPAAAGRLDTQTV